MVHSVARHHPYAVDRVEAKPTAPPQDPVGALLTAIGCSPADCHTAMESAGIYGTDLGTELVAAGSIDVGVLGTAIAGALDLAFQPDLPPDALLGPEPLGAGDRHVRVLEAGAIATLYVAPPLERLEACRKALAGAAKPPCRVVVTTPEAIRAFRDGRSVEARSRAASLAFAADQPRLSARTVMTGAQGFAAGLLAALGLTLLMLDAGRTLLALHVLVSLFFLSHTLMRFAILAAARRPAPDIAEIPLPQGRVPVYSVLVALHREAEMAAPLVRSLAALAWPRSRLEVKLVCEADDFETIAAVRRAIRYEPGFEIVAVPPSLPRTKPKALNFALPTSRGDYVVLYDAEDRPHPMQLREAAARFAAEDPSLACLQAPLAIRNCRANFFTALFALEYAVLFRATLPFLARQRLPIPLGGTSNHFRRGALLAVGGWDSHNVAEDADLGIRLARSGYRTGVIAAPTSEAAPTRWLDWRNQRTRWMKGWMQTWLVHMRSPARLLDELGLRSFLAFHLVFVGMIAGSVMHCLFLAHGIATLVRVASGAPIGATPDWLLAVDLFNIGAAWIVFALLAAKVSLGDERRELRLRLPAVWLYWFLVSLASLRAALQLARAPHLWEKTPHAASDDAPAPRAVACPTA